MEYPQFQGPESVIISMENLVPPADSGESVELEKGPNIKPLPTLDPMPEDLEGRVLIKVGDDISTDEIMPAGARVLPYRSNIPEIAKFVFSPIDEIYYQRAMEHRSSTSFVVAGDNYGQGSSREHAAIAPRYLGLRAVLARSFARIHRQNLINFGILPLTFVDPNDWEKIAADDVLEIAGLGESLGIKSRIEVRNVTRDEKYWTEHSMSDRQTEMVLAGGMINVVRSSRNYANTTEGVHQ